ncbi:MAG: VWA domain-containing protein [bacterium]|nr:VWA domain-containing protein [bacterium]
MQIDFDPYAQLGIASSASSDDVKAAYRRAARRLHPDANKIHPGAGLQFQDITAAYELLMDAGKRQQYDSQAGSLRAAEDHFFTFRVTTSKRTLMPLAEPQVMYLLAEVFPDVRAVNHSEKRESRVNLTLVLDRSNSMNGVRLEKVKAAAHQIIDKLNQDDILSVVIFNDRAEVIIDAAPVKDKAALKARISMMSAFGSTEMYQGLVNGIEQNRKYLAPKLVNHIIVVTDGYTYGDHERSVNLAKSIAHEGITISTMGLGQEWNDVFLDELATATGGHTTYINSPNTVVRFLNDQVRSLANVFAERMMLCIAPDPDIRLESAFKLAPSPQPLSIEQALIPVGGLQFNRNISVLFQLEIPANPAIGFRSLARLTATGDILNNKNQKYSAINDMSIEVTDAYTADTPPTAILDALGKLTLYRMQERAHEAIENGDIKEATRRLEKLATRLFELGEGSLAQQAQSEAQQVAYTNALSQKGRKTLKYTTRFLLSTPDVQADAE